MVELVNACRRDLVTAQPQQIGPLHGPEVGILRPLEQAVDQPGFLVGRGISQEFLRFENRRQLADDVQIDATDKLLVTA